MRLSTAAAPTPLEIRVNGMSGRDPQFVDITMDMSDLMTASGTPAAYGKYRMLQVDTASGPVIYISGGVFARLLGKGRSWARVDGARYRKISGIDLAKQLSNGADISSFLSVLKASGATVTKVGPEKVADTPTTRYRAVVTVERMLSSQGFSASEIAKQKASYREPSVSYDVWIDAQGHPRRMRLDLPVVAQGQKIDERVDMTMSDFGTAGKPAVPAAGVVQDLTERLATQAKKNAAG